MSHPLSIIEAHNLIINVIPANQKQLIADLLIFINKLKSENHELSYYTKKHVYIDYLHVLLCHIPKRKLLNSDPKWMWDCQEIFSNSFNQ